MFAIEVNGNRLHDEGENDAEGRAIRAGGGPLEFATEAEAQAHADALFAALPLPRWRMHALKRSDYKVVPV